ncbi:3754_t:CDS:2, partial [Acaulospora colombiana]
YTMISTSTVAAAIAVLASVNQVAAHGYVEQVWANGQTYWGTNEDGGKPSGSPVLVTDYLTPTYDVWSREIACGINPQGAQGVIEIEAGGSIGWHWVTHSGSDAKTWTHNEGTHRSFLAPCNGDCGSVDVTQLEFTELGSEYTGQQGWDGSTWPVHVLAEGGAWYDKIPDAPTGDYILRNELTALHYSDKVVGSWDNGHAWGTEFYPTCVAIRITRSGGTWNMGNAVKFPGAYQVNQSGHYNPNIWSDPGSVGISSLSSFGRTVWVSGSNNNSGNNNSGSNDNG